MSRVNRENAEDQDLDDNEKKDDRQKHDLVSSSSGSCCSLENSVTTSSSKATTTSSNTGNDISNDNNAVFSRDDCQDLSSRYVDVEKCYKSKNEHETTGLIPSTSVDVDDHPSQVIDRRQEATTSMGQNCDNINNKCPFVTKSENSANFQCNYNDTEDENPSIMPPQTPTLLTNKQQSELFNYSPSYSLQESNSPKYFNQQQELEQKSLLTSSTSASSTGHNKHKQQDQSLASEYNDILRSDSLNIKPSSFGSSYSNLSYNSSTLAPSESNTNDSYLSLTTTRRILKPAPSPSPSLSIIDTNNNKNNKQDSLLSSTKRNNFSKSASGSRLVNINNNNNKSRPNVCDCLTPDCGEKKHSNRRQFIEHYYNSRTQLPSATSTSSFNISTPLNRLSECDAITKRLLSSPIRTINQLESPTRRIQISEVDKSRRASLGTNTITDQVFLFSSNPFKSLELSHNNNGNNKNKNQQCPSSSKASADNQQLQEQEEQRRNDRFDVGLSRHKSGENDIKQQPQCRSLSVCDEETLNPRVRSINSDHSSNLNRAISLACESRSTQVSKRLLTIIPLFGCDIMSLEQFNKLGLILPPIIDSIVDYILVNGVNSIGIFRKSGVKSRILSLKQRIEANQNVKFKELNQNNEFSIYDIADLVKMWFRELRPLPLMTKELIKLISMFLSKQHQFKQVDPDLGIKINSMITLTHRALLAKALGLLEQISVKWETNQMTSQNLAICLTPSLCETESDQNSILLAQKALEFCIENHRQILILDKELFRKQN